MGSARGKRGRGKSAVRKPRSGFSRRGKKGEKHQTKADPPRRRATKKRGQGTYATDRPPVVGTGGRRRGKGRLRVGKSTNQKPWQRHGETYTREQATCTSDEGAGYNKVNRPHVGVSHSRREGAREDEGDGIREVPTNTSEGLWTSVRNFLRPFRGVHKKYLKYYVALCEHAINLKRISPTFIAHLVKAH